MLLPSVVGAAMMCVNTMRTASRLIDSPKTPVASSRSTRVRPCPAEAKAPPFRALKTSSVGRRRRGPMLGVRSSPIGKALVRRRHSKACPVECNENPPAAGRNRLRDPRGDVMQKITRDQARKYAFDWRDEPLLRVRCGEPFEVETYDASTGYFKTPDDKAIPARRPGFDRTPPRVNPIGGPVWLEGAEPGDTLVVAIDEIEVDDYSWIAVGPRRGPLG